MNIVEEVSMKYYIRCEIGSGMFTDELIEARSKEHAEGLARVMCIELADSYGYYQDEDYFGELDSVGKDYNDEEGFYENEAFMEYYAELYDSERHDELLS